MASSESFPIIPVLLGFSCTLLFAGLTNMSRANQPAGAPPPPSELMPAPAHIRFTVVRLPVSDTFSIGVTGHDDVRLQAAISRLRRLWEARTGWKFAGLSDPDASAATLVISCQGPGRVVPSVDEDESYTLEVTAHRAALHAATVVGAMRGMETLGQLLTREGDGFYLPGVEIGDQPRFPWRGLMIDVVRHWQPVEVIKRNLDGMALVKLNVLHLHLTDDQGFRIESLRHPELQEKGSDGNYFTQVQMREIIAYAQTRGIRVVPEFDLPGHATSWIVSHPELASMAGAGAIERRWGVFDPVLDPTNEALYPLLDDFLGEMAALFPDACIHIGGDENNGVQWNANPRIQAFIGEHGLRDNGGLHAHFNHRLATILAGKSKSLIGWDEILHEGLPKDAIIQSWRGPESLAAAACQGYRGILSSGYYLDLMHPAREHYLNDPLPATTTLAAGEQQLILGGEAAMWSEWVTPENIDSRIWPRAAAIAERLWSPRDVGDVDDMYRRLATVSIRLEEAGLLHEKHHEPMVRRLAGATATPADVQALRTLVDVVEPVKDYRRGALQPWSDQGTSLTSLVDCARADSTSARIFSGLVDRFLFQPGALDSELAAEIIQQLEIWNSAGRHVAGDLAGRAPALKDSIVVAQALADISTVGREAVQSLLSGRTPDDGWVKKCGDRLRRADEPGPAAVEFPVLPSLKLLVAAAAGPDRRNTLPPGTWRQYLHTVAFPPEPPAA